jgi:Ser/Thr protein kinase RdoA (MazF antagonist)
MPALSGGTAKKVVPGSDAGAAGRHSRRSVRTSATVAHYEERLAAALAATHHVDAASVLPVAAGESTANYRVTTSTADDLFVKVYPPGIDLDGQVAAIALSEYAAAGGIPAVRIRRDRTGASISCRYGLAYSVWRYLPLRSGEHRGLTTTQMRDMGSVLGRLHRRLAGHRANRSDHRGQDIDWTRVTTVLDALAAAVDDADQSPFRAWARQAVAVRRSLLPRLTAIAAGTPTFTYQLIHGDLAAPNVLLTDDSVGAVIDYQPPTIGAIAHDVSRIGCDPRTVVRVAEAWPDALAGLLSAYRFANPDIPTTDLVGCVRWWICYSGASLYPLRRLLAGEAPTDGSLAAYARARHDALLLVVDRLDEIEHHLATQLRRTD